MLIDPNEVPASGCMELVNAIWDHLDNSRKVCNFISEYASSCYIVLISRISYLQLLLPEILSILQQTQKSHAYSCIVWNFLQLLCFNTNRRNYDFASLSVITTKIVDL